MKLYTDAARDPRTGQAAAGCLIVGTQQWQLSQQLVATDNQQAEFLAAIWGFEQVLAHQTTTEPLFFWTDSRIVSDSVQKQYAKHYPVELAKLLALQARFPLVITQWLPEKQNRGAHELALQGLHQS